MKQKNIPTLSDLSEVLGQLKNEMGNYDDERHTRILSYIERIFENLTHSKLKQRNYPLLNKIFITSLSLFNSSNSPYIRARSSFLAGCASWKIPGQEEAAAEWLGMATHIRYSLSVQQNAELDNILQHMCPRNPMGTKRKLAAIARVAEKVFYSANDTMQGRAACTVALCLHKIKGHEADAYNWARIALGKGDLTGEQIMRLKEISPLKVKASHTFSSRKKMNILRYFAKHPIELEK